jgi:5-methylcytosine-specific restriction enzyme A
MNNNFTENYIKRRGKHMINNNLFWQGAGGASAFNTIFEDFSTKINGKVNTKNRTLGVLHYIKNNQPVEISKYNGEIRDFLYENFNIERNKTELGHLYKPALFFGLIQQNNKNELLLSIEGNLFLDSYNNKKFNNCRNIFINQLDNTIFYKNIATPKSDNLKLFPFRILFKLLLEKNSLSKGFINQSLVRITEIENLSAYIKTKRLDNITSYQIGHRDTKFNDWILTALVSIKVLDRNENGNISINDSIKEYIENLYNNLKFEDYFFNYTTCEVNQKVAKERYKRNAKLVLEAKKRDDFKCKINHEHITFISNKTNYVEGHHIIPMFQQKNYEFILDDINNIISLCPNCHREIH